jgi:formate dehydrogenase alpha subunit
MRLVLGSPHVDSTARLGHHNAVAALREIVGHGRMTVSYEDIDRAQAIVVVGADLTETNPVLSYRVKHATRLSGATLITIGRYGANPGSFVSNLVNRATHPLIAKPGQERAVVLGMLKAVIESGKTDGSLPSGYLDRVRQLAGESGWGAIAAQGGVPRQSIEAAAAAYTSADRAVMLFGRDVVRSVEALDTVRLIADLAIVAGKLTKPGCGLGPACDESNDQGAVELGAAPEYLPGLSAADDPKARQAVASLWKDELPAGPGWTMMDMLEQARAGKLKALYLVGEDPLGDLPASVDVRGALAKLELLICQDSFAGPSAELAHICLPSASFAEKAASWTNQEGRAQRGMQAVELAEQARPDTEIFSEIAGAMGYPLDYAGPRDVATEIARVVPALAPKVATVHKGAVTASVLERYLSGGHARDMEPRFALTGGSDGASEYPFHLTITRSLFRSGALLARSEALTKVPHQGVLLMHPDDAVRLRASDGTTVRLRSRLGSATATVRVSSKARPGQVLFPEHYDDAVRDLVPVTVSPVTRVPVFTSAAVAVEIER